MKKNNIAFWIITILCVLVLLLSPIISYITKNLFLGACIFGVAIILWLITIILHEHRK